MAQGIRTTVIKPIAICKRTSIGGRQTPLNKHKRRSFKRYRGQGRP